MRYAAALVVGLILVGLLSTVVVAEGSIFATSFESEQKIVSTIKILGVGSTKITMESPEAYAYVGYPGEMEYPGSSYFSGLYTVTHPGGDASDVLTSTLSMSFPFTSFSKGENKVGCKADPETWSFFGMYQIADFVNRSHGVYTETIEYKKPPTELGGPIGITWAKSGGKIKADRKTFTKYKGSVVIRYKGTVLSGPNEGKEVKGKLKVKMKKGVPVIR